MGRIFGGKNYILFGGLFSTKREVQRFKRTGLFDLGIGD